MTDHPLTDEMCLESVGNWREKSYCDGMRIAADWQLAQVIEEWEDVIDSNRTGIQVIEEFDKRLKAIAHRRITDDTLH